MYTFSSKLNEPTDGVVICSKCTVCISHLSLSRSVFHAHAHAHAHSQNFFRRQNVCEAACVPDAGWSQCNDNDIKFGEGRDDKRIRYNHMIDHCVCSLERVSE